MGPRAGLRALGERYIGFCPVINRGTIYSHCFNLIAIMAELSRVQCFGSAQVGPRPLCHMSCLIQNSHTISPSCAVWRQKLKMSLSKLIMNTRRALAYKEDQGMYWPQPYSIPGIQAVFARATDSPATGLQATDYTLLATRAFTR